MKPIRVRHRPPETFTELFEAIREVLGQDEYFSVRVDATQTEKGFRNVFKIDVYVAKLSPKGWSKDCRTFLQAWDEFCQMVGHDSGTMEMKMVDVVVGVDDCV